MQKNNLEITDLNPVMTNTSMFSFCVFFIVESLESIFIWFRLCSFSLSRYFYIDSRQKNSSLFLLMIIRLFLIDWWRRNCNTNKWSISIWVFERNRFGICHTSRFCMRWFVAIYCQCRWKILFESMWLIFLEWSWVVYLVNFALIRWDKEDQVHFQECRCFYFVRVQLNIEYIGVSKNSGNSILVPHNKLDKRYLFLHRMTEKKNALSFYAIWSLFYYSVIIIIIKFDKICFIRICYGNINAHW